jgi:hypothetical protein
VDNVVTRLLLWLALVMVLLYRARQAGSSHVRRVRLTLLRVAAVLLGGTLVASGYLVTTQPTRWQEHT